MLKEILKQQKDQIELTINTLLNFKEAYIKLLYIWHSSNILNHTDSLNLYPFHKSFDELEVIEWVEATVNEIRMKLKEDDMKEVLDILEELTDTCLRMADKLYEKSNYDDVEFFIISKCLEKILDRISNLKEKNINYLKG